MRHYVIRKVTNMVSDGYEVGCYVRTSILGKVMVEWRPTLLGIYNEGTAKEEAARLQKEYLRRLKAESRYLAALDRRHRG